MNDVKSNQEPGIWDGLTGAWGGATDAWGGFSKGVGDLAGKFTLPNIKTAGFVVIAIIILIFLAKFGVRRLIR